MSNKETFDEFLVDIQTQSRRFEILQKSELLIGKSGLNYFELKQVAQELNVSPGLIHHYYKSSEHLIFDTVTFSYGKIAFQIQDEATNLQSAEEILRLWITSMLKWLETYPGIGVILQFPEQILRRESSGKLKLEDDYLLFKKRLTEISQRNVMFMASAVRALQKKSKFVLLSGYKIAALMKTDSKFSSYTSLLGFSTMGAGLWIAGRKPSSKDSVWIKFGFNPTKQTNQTIDHLINLIKQNKG